MRIPGILLKHTTESSPSINAAKMPVRLKWRRTVGLGPPGASVLFSAAWRLRRTTNTVSAAAPSIMTAATVPPAMAPAELPFEPPLAPPVLLLVLPMPMFTELVALEVDVRPVLEVVCCDEEEAVEPPDEEGEAVAEVEVAVEVPEVWLEPEVVEPEEEPEVVGVLLATVAATAPAGDTSAHSAGLKHWRKPALVRRTRQAPLRGFRA